MYSARSSDHIQMHSVCITWLIPGALSICPPSHNALFVALAPQGHYYKAEIQIDRQNLQKNLWLNWFLQVFLEN